MYIKIEDGAIVAWPYSTDRLLEENPNVSFPVPIPNETLEKYGIFEVQNVLAPYNNDDTKKIIEGLPRCEEGVWKRYYEIVDLDEGEMNSLKENKKIHIRYERNRLLQETDWSQCKDIPDEVSAKYVEYRQALRDITSQEGFPLAVQWPSLTSDEFVEEPVVNNSVGPIEPDVIDV